MAPPRRFARYSEEELPTGIVDEPPQVIVIYDFGPAWVLSLRIGE